MAIFSNIKLIINMIKRTIKIDTKYPLDTLSLLIRPIINIIPLILFSTYIGVKNNVFYKYTNTNNYIQYITISFFFIAFISNCIISSSILITSELENGTFELIVLAPIHPIQYIMSYIISTFLVYLLNFFIFYYIIIFIFDKIILFNNVLVLIYICILSMITCFGIGTLLAGITVKTKLPKVTYMVNSILVLLAGASYSISIFPKPLKIAAFCNPITYCVDIFRYSIINTKTYFNLKIEMIIITCISIITFIIGIIIFDKIFNNLKRNGKLTNY